jgi:hypothetical protein
MTMPTARLFNAWIEDWEEDAIKRKDPVNEAKLLKKYGGLHWLDPDNNNIELFSERNYMYWHRSFRQGSGYTLIAYDEFYRADDDNKAQHTEPWCITNDLIELIADYYRNNPTLDKIIIVEKNNSRRNSNDDSIVIIEDDMLALTL